ncbi:MAG: hypothetical protein ACREN4_08345 [Candidatus Dormibacteria bacterium]
MVAVAALLGVAFGAGVGLVLRRERAFTLAALAVMAIALALALLLAGAGLPALGMVLLGGVTAVVLLAPATTARIPRPRPGGRAQVALAVLAGLAGAGVLLGAGVASRSDLGRSGRVAPSLTLVGQHLVMGTGVAALALLLLAAVTVVGAAALAQRDPREAAEEQVEQARARRREAQERRQAAREAARAASRAARRGSGR